VLFKYEERRRMRFLNHARTQFDFVVLRITHALHRVTDMVGRDTFRQIFHYMLHIVLRVILVVNKQWEKSLRNMIQVNKAMAQNAERDRKTRNKLEEVALHKLRTALTEEEKKLHKDKILEG
jgi:hypothetical protein